jgi:lipopolysaccharide transport system permease protein
MTTSTDRKNLEVNITAGGAHLHYWSDLWRYRELFYFLAWRDLLVRYKQTVVGVAWAVLRPVLTLTILVIVFGKLAGMETEQLAPYPVIVFCGLLPWQFFSVALTESGNSLVTNSNMISKIYFPRLIVPASSMITSLVDFTISAVILAGVMACYGFVPSANIIFLPIFILLALMAAFGTGVWISALMVKYRDFRFIVPFIVQFGLYISPVGFKASIVPEKYQLLYSLNPMVGVIDGFRWAIIGGEEFQVNWQSFGISALLVSLILISGVIFFRRTERTFADII